MNRLGVTLIESGFKLFPAVTAHENSSASTRHLTRNFGRMAPEATTDLDNLEKRVASVTVGSE